MEATTSSDQEKKKPIAAWHDDDDEDEDEDIEEMEAKNAQPNRVSLAAKAITRKLRETEDEDVVTTSTLETRLRQQ